MKKRILFGGSVYDLSKMTTAEMEKAVHDKMSGYLGLDFNVSVQEIDPKELEVTIFRHYPHEDHNNAIKKGSILEEDLLLVTGEYEKEYFPKYSLMYLPVPHFPNMIYTYSNDELIDIYKKNIRDRKASRVKDMELDIDKDKITVRFKY